MSMAFFIILAVSVNDEKYFVSLGKQCALIPSRASGISMFHFVLQAFLHFVEIQFEFLTYHF